MHNDLERAARDPNYRLLYENSRRQEKAAQDSKRDADYHRKQAKREQDEESRVICTQVYRQGLMSRQDYLLGLRYVRENLTERHERGYHAWAISVVRMMRRSNRATRFWSKLAAARADHIAFVYGDRSRRNRFGALLCAVGHPACYIIGGFVDEQDFRALYRDEAAQP